MRTDDNFKIKLQEKGWLRLWADEPIFEDTDKGRRARTRLYWELVDSRHNADTSGSRLAHACLEALESFEDSLHASRLIGGKSCG